jgi:hypothetical protein
MLTNSVKFIKQRLEYLILIPFLVNFIINFISKNLSIPHLEITNIFFSFLCFLFLYNVSIIISKSLEINSKSFSIVLYLLSFFAIDYSFLFYQNQLQFSHIFYIVNIFWILFTFLKSRNLMIKNYALSVGIYYLIFLTKNFLGNNILGRIAVNSDVEYFWLPMSKMIYENNLYFALQNNIEPGYGLLINHIHSILFKLFINYPTFEFIPALTNLFIYLVLLTIYETNLHTTVKISMQMLSLSIILNSDWLSYLLINSLMGEGVVNFIFPIVILTLNRRYISSITYINYFSYFLIGFIYLSKPFVSILLLLAITFCSINQRKFEILFFGMFGFVINFLNYNYVLDAKYSSNYFNVTEFYNFQNITDISFSNILSILLNLLILDRVMSTFVLIFICIVLYNKIKNGFKLEKNLPLLNIILNIAFVFILYVSIWSDRELESAYRYIFSIFSLFILHLGYEIQDIKYNDRDYKLDN